MSPIRELERKLNSIQNMEDAQRFLENLAKTSEHGNDFEYPEASEFILAISAVISEVPNISECLSDKDVKVLCSVLLAASIYE